MFMLLGISISQDLEPVWLPYNESAFISDFDISLFLFSLPRALLIYLFILSAFIVTDIFSYFFFFLLSISISSLLINFLWSVHSGFVWFFLMP